MISARRSARKKSPPTCGTWPTNTGNKLIEAVADEDESIMETFLEGGEVVESDIRAALRRGTIGVRLVPVVCGTAYRNKGVIALLDAIVDYMPSPLDISAMTGINPKTDEEETREVSDDEPFSALAFKIATDPFVGKLCFFRVYSGTLNKGSTVLNATKGKRERLSRILPDARQPPGGPGYGLLW